MTVDRQRHALDVALQGAAAASGMPKAGTAVLGRITAVGGAGGGVRVQLSARRSGRVALTDIHDAAVQQALAGLAVGQYVRAVVLGPDPAAGGSKGRGAGAQLLLSLRPAAGGQCAAHKAAAKPKTDVPAVAAGALQPQQLKEGQRVSGWGRAGSTVLQQLRLAHPG